jgi:hypothetical protein
LPPSPEELNRLSWRQRLCARTFPPLGEADAPAKGLAGVAPPEFFVRPAGVTQGCITHRNSPKFGAVIEAFQGQLTLTTLL